MALRVTLSWEEAAPETPGDGFRIYRSVNGGSYSLLATVPINQTTYQDDVSEGNLYRYKITEYKQLHDQNGTYTIESPASSVVIVRVPISPSAEPAYNDASRVYPAFWPTRYAAKFRIERRSPGGTWETVATVPNKVVSEGGNADIDGSKWSFHLGASKGSYGSSGGYVFWQTVSAGGLSPSLYSTNYVYSVTAAKAYLLGIELYCDQKLACAKVHGQLRRSSDNGIIGEQCKYISLKPSWQRLFFVVSPSEDCSEVRLEFKVETVSGQDLGGYKLRYRNPIFVELPDTDFSKCQWRVIAIGSSNCPVSPGVASPLLPRKHKITLSWDEGDPPPPDCMAGDGFRIYRSVDGGEYAEHALVPISQTSYDDLLVEPGKTYAYKVEEIKGSLAGQQAAAGNVKVPRKLKINVICN